MNPIEMEQDIVIVGAGMAGLVSAIEAASAGAKVTVIDKLGPLPATDVRLIAPGKLGNDTARSMGGGLARFSPEILASKLGDSGTHQGDYIQSNVDTYSDPIRQLCARHMEKNWGKVDSDLIMTYLERIFADCKWFRDELRAPYQYRMIKGGGPGLIAFLYKAAEARGIKIIFNTKATRLFIDDVGRVTGVQARSTKGLLDLTARALILATGSFGSNQEMMLKYVGPEITYNSILTGCPTNTGDGHLMALEIGAQLVNLSACHIRTTDKFLGVGPSRALPNIYPMGLYVNKRCQRFLDESIADSDTIGNAIAFQTGGVAALIFDKKAVDKYPNEYEMYPRREEVIQVASTIDELAAKIEVSAEGLNNLIKDFNNAVENGKALKLPVPKTEQAYRLDMPPFYGFYPVLPGLNHPLGGVKTNTRSQVLDRDGNPITGLYAAGSIQNWAFGKPYEIAGVTSYKGSYHAGASSGLGTALVFGRIAGRSAAEEARQIQN